MDTESRTVKSTSLRSAVTDDIVIRETGTTRLVFRPILVTNEREPNASVKGSFVFQRKSSKKDWTDIEVPPLSSLKKDQAVKLELKSQELLRLYDELSSLYDLYRSEGIPKGETKFIKANATVHALASLSDEELSAVIGGRESIGAQALSRLIHWASQAENFSMLFERLQLLGQYDLVNLNSALGVASLKRAIKKWHENRRNPDEEFWQNTFSGQAFVLEQVFQVPVVIVKSKAYVGGKSVMNKGGHVVDFLVKNKVTNAVALIEIKTPMTSLLGKEYRQGVYTMSEDLSGAVMQAMAYRDSLLQERVNLLQGEGSGAEAFDPSCVVIIGHARRELDVESKRRSFELYRRQLRDVRVITYDELYERTTRLVRVLEQGME